MKISVGEGVEDLDDDGVKSEGVDNSLSPPVSTINCVLPFNGDICREILSIGEKELNSKGGVNAVLSLDTFWMLPLGVRLKVAGEG